MFLVADRRHKFSVLPRRSSLEKQQSLDRLISTLSF
jgi:hypothetical protein